MDGALARLRAETRSEHLAIEATLRLTVDDLTLVTYRHRLEQLYGFYRPIEADLREVCDWSRHGLDLDARRKTPLLVADLRSLGWTDVAGIPLCSDLPPLPGVAEGFGCLYVLEGATLGGRIVTRHLRGVLGDGFERAGRFFGGYGERTAEMWCRFREALARFADGGRDTGDRTVVSAVATFRALRRWCARGEAR